jgi:hypothetical protein
MLHVLLISNALAVRYVQGDRTDYTENKKSSRHVLVSGEMDQTFALATLVQGVLKHTRSMFFL